MSQQDKVVLIFCFFSMALCVSKLISLKIDKAKREREYQAYLERIRSKHQVGARDE